MGETFPTKAEWYKVLKNMAGLFPGSQPVGIWLLSTIWPGGDCALEFKYSGDYDYITPKTGGTNYEKHDQFLSMFDTAGIKVYLQVESGMADMVTLINLVMNKFKSHPCVVGFGVDVEWYKTTGASNRTKPVTDSIAKVWDTALKAHNGSYRFFLKHWLPNLMPPTYRSDIVFIDDGMGYPSLDSLADDFKIWADKFPANTVMFQVGYDFPGPTGGPSDYLWWKNLQNPPLAIGDTLASRINNPGQGIGVI